VLGSEISESIGNQRKKANMNQQENIPFDRGLNRLFGVILLEEVAVNSGGKDEMETPSITGGLFKRSSIGD
jgi:hypothetical protein